MALKLSSTRMIAHGLNTSVRAVGSLLGHTRSLKVLGQLRYLLTSHAEVVLGDRRLRLVILDRHGSYWALDGTSSEPKTIGWINGFAADDVFYDIGANVGLYSLYASLHRHCRCVALEPNPFSFDALIRNMLLNQLQGRITALCLAAAQHDGITALGFVSDQSGAIGSTLTDRNGAGARIDAMVTRLDTLVQLNHIPFPNHIKIDVDGIEDLVVAGALSTLGDNRVRSLLIEVCDGPPERLAKLNACLHECGLTHSEHQSSTSNWVFNRA